MNDQLGLGSEPTCTRMHVHLRFRHSGSLSKAKAKRTSFVCEWQRKNQKRAFTAWQGPTSVIWICIPHIEYHIESKNDPIWGSVLVCTYCVWVLLSQWVRAIPHQRSFTRLHGSVRNTQGVCELWGLWEWARGRRKNECRGFTSFLGWNRGKGRDYQWQGFGFNQMSCSSYDYTFNHINLDNLFMTLQSKVKFFWGLASFSYTVFFGEDMLSHVWANMLSV